MRKPTVKETHVLKNCLKGLEKDVATVVRSEPSRDVHGTFRTNLEVMERILRRLEREHE